MIFAAFIWTCMIAMITAAACFFAWRFGKEQDRRIALRRKIIAERAELLDMLAKVRAKKAAEAQKRAALDAATPAE